MSRRPTFHRRTPSSGFSPGFSLVELLVVIAIIGLLAALILQTAGFVQNKAARSRAETEIKALEAALESYRADQGEYPTGSNVAPATANNFLRQALMPDTGKVYFEFPKSMTPRGVDQADPDQPVLDPWGNGFGYTFPGDSTRNGASYFDLWSTGGSADPAQWIKNW